VASDFDAASRRIATNLGLWGEAVEGLRRRDPSEWELLSRQLQFAVVRFQCPQELKEDAVVAAIIRLLEVLDRMPAPQAIEAADEGELAALIAAARPYYDFSAPLYTYARVIACNALRDLLRRRPEFTFGDLLLDLLPAPQQVTSEESAAAEAEARLALAAVLGRLLEQIDELPRRQRDVLYLTLGAKPQFWRAVEAVDLPPPPRIDAALLGAMDTQIAGRLNTDANNVRVLRSLAKRRIAAADHMAGDLLARLLE
jgi:hypothetical protein